MHRLAQLLKSPQFQGRELEKKQLPFALYSSVQEQHLVNVPILNPMLMVVIEGSKALGRGGEVSCQVGDFIFLSDNPSVEMRNIPKNKEYLALIIEFDYQDISDLSSPGFAKENYCTGRADEALELCLYQFVEWSLTAPQSLWPLRKREIVQLLNHMGYQQVLSMLTPRKVGQRVSALLSRSPADDIPVESLCQQLAMSESTLRRKLTAEGTSLQAIKDQLRLGLGLHLVQTTQFPIAHVAQQCGYQSQSRFTSRFKERFGVTPSELRKTRLIDIDS
jgi:AraC-like DNA-binding protein